MTTVISPAFPYRYYTGELLQDQGMTEEQFRNYIERGTTWKVVGHDTDGWVWVCRRAQATHS